MLESRKKEGENMTDINLGEKKSEGGLNGTVEWEVSESQIVLGGVGKSLKLRRMNTKSEEEVESWGLQIEGKK